MVSPLLRCAALLVAMAAPAAAGEPPPEAIRSARATRLDGKHFTAEVEMRIERDGKREDRRLRVWRDDETGNGERIMARFLEPPDLRDFGLLFLERSGRPNDYFVHQPELRRVRRVSESVVSQDIYGVDLEFLGFGVAQSVRTASEDLAAGELDGRAVWRLTERALEANQRFDERVSWIDAATSVPLRTEHRRAGRPVMIARVLRLEPVHGVPTPMESSFERPGEGERVHMVVRHIDYETPIDPDFFSTLALIKR